MEPLFPLAATIAALEDAIPNGYVCKGQPVQLSTNLSSIACPEISFANIVFYSLVVPMGHTFASATTSSLASHNRPPACPHMLSSMGFGTPDITVAWEPATSGMLLCMLYF